MKRYMVKFKPKGYLDSQGKVVPSREDMGLFLTYDEAVAAIRSTPFRCMFWAVEEIEVQQEAQ
jgi:hypothetical protein